MLTVVIPTYNPDIQRLNQALAGLQKQDLDRREWELIIIDNNSSVSFGDQIDLSWSGNARVKREARQGLTFARLKGFSEARGEIIVLLDDDNLPAVNYLSEVKKIFENHPELGAAGGKSEPVFETDPPAWLPEFYKNLALRDLGNNIIIDKWDHKYPAACPIGAGMALRKSALETYIRKITGNAQVITDRTGNSLTSGGDNDINLELLKSGWATGYFPSLVIHHYIPKERLQRTYLARLLMDTNRSWVRLLENHEINPWPKIGAWTVNFRKIKAWFTYQAWRNTPCYLNWKGACGLFEGLAESVENPKP